MQKAPHWDKRGRLKLPHRRDLSEALVSCGSVLTVRLFGISLLHCWLSFLKKSKSYSWVVKQAKAEVLAQGHVPPYSPSPCAVSREVGSARVVQKGSFFPLSERVMG